MKRLLSIFTVLFWCGFSAQAEKVVATYTLSYFEKEYEIEASEIKNDKFTIYIQVSAENSSTRAMIGVESDKIAEFIQSLQQMKDKYVEWFKVAKENNVKELTKEMDISFPSTTICWKGTEWYFSFGQRLIPKYIILDSGKNVVTFVNKVTASSNEYIDETTYWVFSDSKEIDDLIAALNVEKIKSKLLEKVKAADLFK